MRTKIIRGLSISLILLGAIFLSCQPVLKVTETAECSLSRICSNGVTVSCETKQGKCSTTEKCVVCTEEAGKTSKACC